MKGCSGMLENFEMGKPPRWVTPQKQSGWSGRAMVVGGVGLSLVSKEGK